MSFGGKLLFGLLGYWIGGWVGLAIGLFIGHMIDRTVDRVQAWNPFRPYGSGEQQQVTDALIDTAFAIFGHLAKSDGRVSESEIAAAEALMTRMQLSESQRAQARSRFRDGKADDFPLDQVVAAFAHRIRRRRHLTLVFMEMMLGAAMADGVISPEEEAILLRVGQGLGLPSGQFQQIMRMLAAQARFARDAAGQQQWQQQGSTGGAGSAGAGGWSGAAVQQAYDVLGVSAQASDADIKRAYRKLMSQHHPDKLAAKGVPPEMIRVATEKSAEITRAYDVIKKHRNIT